MKSILDRRYRQGMIERIMTLAPDDVPRWGAMIPHEMMCHLIDQIKTALGENPIEDGSNIITRTIVKYLTLKGLIPVPRGKLKTSPKMLLTNPSEWVRDREHLVSLIERMSQGGEDNMHPVFGILSHDEWARMSAIHIDHHLQQFGR